MRLYLWNLSPQGQASHLAAPNVSGMNSRAAGGRNIEQQQLSLPPERTRLVSCRDGPHPRASFPDRFPAVSRMDLRGLDGLTENARNSNIDLHATAACRSL
jgi:hypothetical protein